MWRLIAKIYTKLHVKTQFEKNLEKYSNES